MCESGEPREGGSLLSRDVVIVEGLRTPFVRAGEDLREVPVDELGRSCCRDLLDRCGISPAEIDELILGCCAQPPDRANPARVVALRSGLPIETPAHTVARNCASGMQAVSDAFDRIRGAAATSVLAGGAESMSRIPLLFPLSFGFKVASLARARSLPEKMAGLFSFRWKDLKPKIGLLEGLRDPFSGEMMGNTAERLAREWGISRSDQDLYALESHQKAVAATDLLKEEISSIAIPPRLDQVIRQDIGPRPNAKLEKMARMKPYFDRKLGSVTVANSCGITDGAAMLLLMDSERASALGYKPLARVLATAFLGLDPLRMGLGPVHALARVLDGSGLVLSDIDRVELNEAFAAQVLACQAALDDETYSTGVGFSAAPGSIATERLNVQGGAIALGHPVGASGARLILTLARQLQRAGGGHGIATMCVGGGQGGAVLLEGIAS
ncbi:MAG TPA: thiolase family protein [Planctomycetes bacterium]|nr:thiolase family protein [Planctomycetota bacterium]